MPAVVADRVERRALIVDEHLVAVIETFDVNSCA